MRVNVTYSVELEDVPQTAAKLIHETKEGSLRPLAKKLDEALILLNKEFGSPKIIRRKKQLADVYKTHGSNKKLIKITKFKDYTDIETGLCNVIQWAKNNKNLLK